MADYSRLKKLLVFIIFLIIFLVVPYVLPNRFSLVVFPNQYFLMLWSNFSSLMLLYFMYIVIESIDSGEKIIQNYMCFSKQNFGQDGELDGELRHHFGVKSCSPFVKSEEVWEYNNVPCGNTKNGEVYGSTLIYGPYSYDFIDLNNYIIRFKIAITGSTAKNKYYDLNIFELDVNRISSAFFFADRDLISADKQEKKLRKFIKCSDFKKNRWTDFDLVIQPELSGFYEYRVIPIFKNIEKLKSEEPGIRIYFKSISVIRCLPFKNPWS